MKYIYYVILVCIITSCSNNGHTKLLSNNKKIIIKAYTIDSFFKEYDSSKFIINKYAELTEILDSPNITGERGLYKFDENNNLRFYGFLLDKNNNGYFGVEYDSLGNEINRTTKSYVVRWFVSKLKNNKLKVSFLLYTINYAYGDIQFNASDSLINIPIFKSKYFSNLDAGEAVIDIPKNKLVYITGKVQNNQSLAIHNFSDSFILPLEKLK